jgi:hypothetical protein
MAIAHDKPSINAVLLGQEVAMDSLTIIDWLFYKVKLSKYAPFDTSKKFCFDAKITWHPDAKTAQVNIISYKDTGCVPSNFDEEILPIIKRELALWLKENTSINSFSLAIRHPNGADLSGDFDITACLQIEDPYEKDFYTICSL